MSLKDTSAICASFSRADRLCVELERMMPGLKEASVVMRQASHKIEAGHKMAQALRHAEKLAWEVGTETEDGVKTLLQDSRGDLYREIVAALAEWEQT